MIAAQDFQAQLGTSGEGDFAARRLGVAAGFTLFDRIAEGQFVIDSGLTAAAVLMNPGDVFGMVDITVCDAGPVGRGETDRRYIRTEDLLGEV